MSNENEQGLAPGAAESWEDIDGGWELDAAEGQSEAARSAAPTAEVVAVEPPDLEPVVEVEPEPVVEAAPEPVVEAEPEPVVEAEPEPEPVAAVAAAAADPPRKKRTRAKGKGKRKQAQPDGPAQNGAPKQRKPRPQVASAEPRPKQDKKQRPWLLPAIVGLVALALLVLALIARKG